MRSPYNYLDILHRVLHELMQAVGFWHEQSRADRDDYVIMNWNYIEHGKRNINYKKHNETSMIGEYDLCSVMHYRVGGGAMSLTDKGRKETKCYRKGSHCFVYENKERCSCWVSGENGIGNGRTFTALDIWKINFFYKDVSKKV